MHSCFENRIAVVTGASGGMGRQTARRLALAGCHVGLVDLKPAADPLHERETYFQGDLTDAAFVESVMNRLAQAHGRIHYLVNAAGVLWFDRDRSMLDIDLDVWDRVLEINLKSMLLATRFATAQMPGGAAMVHISSSQCLRGDDKPQDAYQASKAAIIAASKSLAIQLAQRNIRSNVLIPGPTASPMQERWQAAPELAAAAARATPLGKVAVVDDMANAILFLLSDYATHITGTELIVDGGLLARP